MCTSIGLKAKDYYFGRNMDLDYNFNEKVIIMPRNYSLNFKKCPSFLCHYAMIGMGMLIDDYPLYAEGTNEKGLCIASTKFTYHICYNEKEDLNKANISVYELIPWILSQCASTDEAEDLIKKTNIINLPFSKEIPIEKLHWHISDHKRSIVVECLSDGMKIYNNPIDILTNNPTFDFQLHNLTQYLNLTTDIPFNCFSEMVKIENFGNGVGSHGLPGDFSSMSRFVKIAFLKLNSKKYDNEVDNVTQFFHLLDSVAVINGAISVNSKKEYYTQYNCCINANKGIYYFKTYENNQINAINMFNEDLDSKKLIAFELIRKQSISQRN